MVGSMKWMLMSAIVILSLNSNAQYSLGGGVSTLFQFGNAKPFGGLHFTVEFPRNNEVTFYGRMTYHFRQNKSQRTDLINNEASYAYAYDFMTNPNSLPLDASFVESFNYFIIDGGTRYYIINGYDEGFALYGGSNIAFIVNTVRYKYEVEEYNQELYYLTPNVERGLSKNKGTIINLAAGLSGGAKYTFPGVGTLYFDFNPSLVIFGLPSKEGIETSLYKNVVFNMSLGFRKEFY